MLASVEMAAMQLILAVLTLSAVAQATEVCDPYGWTLVQNRYVVMNNRWGSSDPQCIETTDTGFKITRQDGSSSSSPVSYPALFYGCHYANCSPGTVLPLKLSTIKSATSSVSFALVPGRYDAAYDIWLDPNPNNSGPNAQEVMIWLDRQGGVGPLGSQTTSATILGRQWGVWTGNNGVNEVISYVAPSTIGSIDFNVLDFLNDAKNRGLYTDQWYLTSIQAGFEPWSGGVGLGVTNFACNIS